jgi:hypothetical protein
VGAVEDDQLALPPGLSDQGHHVADGAGAGDLPGEAEDGPVLGVAAAVLTDIAHDDEVRRRRHEAEGPLPGAHALAGRLSHGVGGARRVHAHELEPLIVHPASL